MSTPKIQPLTPEWHDRWDAFVDAHPAGWFWHTHSWLQYLNDYYPGSEAWHFGITEGDAFNNICPFLFEKGAILGGGIPLPHPLISQEPNKPDALLVDQLMDSFKRTMASKWEIRNCPLMTARPLVYPMGLFAREQEYRSRIVDLSPPCQTLFRALRKSYQQIIRTKGILSKLVGLGQTWNGEAEHLFTQYMATHQRIHQPERQLVTYEHQRQWLKDGKALLLASQANPGQGSDNGHVVNGFQPDAFLYFVHAKQKAYYMSGVQAGSSLIHPLWASLLALKDLGIQEVELGWEDYDTSEKGKNIAFFKQGFGGESRPWWVMRYG